MGYPTKVQLISRKKGADQYYINFPTAVAEAMEFQKGEIIEWIVGKRLIIPSVQIGRSTAKRWCD